MARKKKKKFWAFGPSKHPTCYNGEPDCDNCHNVRLIGAKPSKFHDQTLIDATQRINAIFDELRGQADPGLHLALINTGLGLLLIWAMEGDRPDDTTDLVTYWSTADEIVAALGLEPEAGTKRPAPAGQSDPEGGSAG
jgi:hypothetical protein